MLEWESQVHRKAYIYNTSIQECRMLSFAHAHTNAPVQQKTLCNLCRMDKLPAPNQLQHKFSTFPHSRQGQPLTSRQQTSQHRYQLTSRNRQVESPPKIVCHMCICACECRNKKAVHQKIGHVPTPSCLYMLYVHRDGTHTALLASIGSFPVHHFSHLFSKCDN